MGCDFQLNRTNYEPANHQKTYNESLLPFHKNPLKIDASLKQNQNHYSYKRSVSHLLFPQPSFRPKQSVAENLMVISTQLTNFSYNVACLALKSFDFVALRYH